MNLWFTADQHYWHKNIIRHCDRPFANLKEMHRVLIDNFNSVVTNKDYVWHLGDLAWINNIPMVKKIFKELNGKKHHVLTGNHDRWFRRAIREKISIHRVTFHEPLTEIKHEGQRITLCHYALMTWPASGRGSWMLHGHSHGNIKHEKGFILDIGVDCHNFFPVSFNQVKDYMTTREHRAVDHHKEIS